MNTELYKYDNLVEDIDLVKRPSKTIKSPYIADILVENNEEFAHCPALGVSGLLNNSSTFLCSKNEDTKRKSKYTIELVYLPSTKNTYTLTNTNPLFGNRIFANIIKNNLLEEYKNNSVFKAEKTYKDSRFDFYIKKENSREEFIEVKSVLLCDFMKDDYPANIIKNPEISKLENYKKAAIFPDGFRKNKNVPISTRAIKHLETLEDCVQNGYDATLCFIVQREDCDYFKPSNVDQFYYTALQKAKNNGVNIIAIKVRWTNTGQCLYQNKIDVIIPK